MSKKAKILCILSAMLVFLAANSIYILDQRQYGIVIQFGDVVRRDMEPGLKFKVPFIQETVFFDNRIQNIVFSAGDSSEVVSSDQKTMKLTAFSKYRISDPYLFFTSVKNEYVLRTRISALIESAIREVIGGVQFGDVLGEKRHVIMSDIVTIVKAQMRKFGIELLDVRVTRLALPEKARDAVYARMRTEREKEAHEIRAGGDEQAHKIRADADREKTIKIADAKKQAQTLRGEAEAKAIEILSNVIGKDVDFFEFYRSIEAYKNTFGKDDTKMVVTTDIPFLKYMDGEK